jgi:tRNA-splicing ligase RtcB
MISLKTKLTKEHIRSKEIRRKWIDAVLQRVALGCGREQMPQQYKVNDKKLKEILVNGSLAFETKNLDKFEKTNHPVKEYVHYEKAYNRGYYQLSSLGGGNHFCELQQDLTGNIWIMIHTGSRGYGHQIATDFFNEGLAWHNSNNTQKLAPKDKELINFPVDSDIGKRYLNAMNQAANFALVNRYLIYKAIEEATIEVFNDCPEIVYEISHNLVQFENNLWIHRKGATRAFPKGSPLLKGSCYESTGHPILIPGSMGTASAILYAEDSEKSLYSINHGCGRVMSRGFAKRNLVQSTVDKEMDDLDILYNTRHVPIDECMHAYKDIGEVLKTVEDANLAKVAINLIPRAVIKGFD